MTLNESFDINNQTLKSQYSRSLRNIAANETSIDNLPEPSFSIIQDETMQESESYVSYPLSYEESIEALINQESKNDKINYTVQNDGNDFDSPNDEINTEYEEPGLRASSPEAHKPAQKAVKQNPHAKPQETKQEKPVTPADKTNVINSNATTYLKDLRSKYGLSTSELNIPKQKETAFTQANPAYLDLKYKEYQNKKLSQEKFNALCNLDPFASTINGYSPGVDGNWTKIGSSPLEISTYIIHGPLFQILDASSKGVKLVNQPTFKNAMSLIAATAGLTPSQAGKFIDTAWNAYLTVEKPDIYSIVSTTLKVVKPGISDENMKSVADAISSANRAYKNRGTGPIF